MRGSASHRISDLTIMEVRAATDIVWFISHDVELAPRSSGTLCGVCPWHADPGRSLVVSRERQAWRCPSCGRGGDVLAWAMEPPGREGRTFAQAVRHLAHLAGLTIRTDCNNPSKES